MIVVEGPDGGGKTQLAEHLVNKLRLAPGRKYSSSELGPNADMVGTMRRDMRTWCDTDTLVYDRHPLISEPIYGPLVRGENRLDVLDANYLERKRDQLITHCLVIVCLPPVATVRRVVNGERDMPGVSENLAELYVAYVTWFREFLLAGGHCARYDYSQGTMGGHTLDQIEAMARRHARMRMELMHRG